ncbi:MAG: sensor histidine kinase [Candidatus Velthaea sp.]
MARDAACAPVRARNWTPLLWLVYLLWLPVNPILDHASGPVWALTGLATVVFLAVYLPGLYLVQDRRLKLAIVCALFALGTATLTINIGAASFFVYGAGFIGHCFRPRRAYQFLLGYCIAIPLISGLLLHGILWGWVMGVVFSSIYGIVSIRHAEEETVNAKLRLAHDEVERLAKVAERERIARDLHDVLGHTLSLIVLKSELASKLSARDAQLAADEIRDVEKIARDALQDLRAAVTGYKSAGIAAEFDRARSVLETAGVSVDAEAQSLRLPPTHEGVLSLAIRESVTNVVRHAQAHVVRMRLAEENGACRFEIADDGRGSHSLTEGNGLSGMRERIEALGGTMVRDGGAGTRLVLTLPLAR